MGKGNNIRDMGRHGYTQQRGSNKSFDLEVRRGSNNPVSKLDEAKVLDIMVKLRLKYTQAELADEYSVSPAAINSIKLGRTWKHVHIPSDKEEYKALVANIIEKEVIKE